jgi:uncharacterized protein with FMN-binding domain
MKDIIRTGIFVLIGIILLVALIWAIMPRGGPEAAIGADFGNFIPGTYTSYIILHNRPVGISVTVDEDRILDIVLSEMDEAVEVFYPLIRPTMVNLSAQVISTQSTEIQAPPETLHTTRILLDAINLAIYQAQVAD